MAMSLGGTGGIVTIVITIVIALIVVITVIGDTTPDIQTAVNSVNETNQCSAQGCVWNGTEAAPSQCRTGSGPAGVNDTDLPCAKFVQAPLSGLFTGGGVIVLIFLAAALIATVILTFKMMKAGN